MNLSPHFTLEEFTQSQTAARLGLDNTPDDEVLGHLKYTAARLEVVRELLGHPIVISSGYRSTAVNQAVGGVSVSAHTQGYAVDFLCPAYGSPFEVCSFLAGLQPLKFDQLIYEFGQWTHISFAPAMRQQTLTILNAAMGYRSGIHASL